MSNYAFEGPKWSSSVITWSFAAAGGDFSDAITTAYQSTIRAAVARWSQVANLTFKEVVDSAVVNIRIGWANFTGTQVGETNFGFTVSGTTQVFKTGVEVRLADPAIRPVGTAINSYYQNTTTTLYQSVLHELGHALGLAHSTDPTAVMYASIGLLDNDLNASDIQGIVQLYGGNPMPVMSATTLTAPAATITSSVISVYRFFDASNGTQFLTADVGERNNVIATRSDLTYEGPGLGALSSPAGDANAVPVYRFFDTRNGSHFFTTSASEDAQILATRPDLVGEKPSFYEHATQAAGDVPVYRFFDSSTGTHFFTNSSAEKAQLQSTRPDFSLEGVAFYAPSVSAASGVAQSGNAAAQATPQANTIADTTGSVYRFDTADGRQLLTADPSECNTVLRVDPNFVYAGPVMGTISPDAGDSNVVPIFRFFNAASGDHFLTADAKEAAQLVATSPDLLQERTGFYEHLTQADGDVPIYRFFDTATGTHLYTGNPSEHASILATRPEMTQEGIAFYAPLLHD